MWRWQSPVHTDPIILCNWEAPSITVSERYYNISGIGYCTNFSRLKWLVIFCTHAHWYMVCKTDFPMLIDCNSETRDNQTLEHRTLPPCGKKPEIKNASIHTCEIFFYLYLCGGSCFKKDQPLPLCGFPSQLEAICFRVLWMGSRCCREH